MSKKTPGGPPQANQDLPKVGERYRLTVDVDRWPSFVAAKGMEGTVEFAYERRVSGGVVRNSMIGLKMDEVIEQCADWDNCVEWYDGWEMDDDGRERTAVEMFRRDTERI